MSILHDFLLICLPLFVVLDVAGTVPVYLALTEQYSEEQRRKIAARATIVAAFTGVIFIILGQAVFNFMGVRIEDFQIAGGMLLVVLTMINILGPKPEAGATTPAELDQTISVVPLAVPLIVGPATLTTCLLLVNTYSKYYNQAIVELLVSIALLLNLLLLFLAMRYSKYVVAVLGKSVMTVVNKIVMILLAAIAVSLIRQGVVSIVQDLRHTP